MDKRQSSSDAHVAALEEQIKRQAANNAKTRAEVSDLRAWFTEKIEQIFVSLALPDSQQHHLKSNVVSSPPPRNTSKEDIQYVKPTPVYSAEQRVDLSLIHI